MIINADLKDLAWVMIESHGDGAEHEAREMAATARKTGHDVRAAQWDQMAEIIAQLRAAAPDTPTS